MRLHACSVVLFLLAQVGCGDNLLHGPSDVSLDQTAITLAVHDTAELHAQVSGAPAGDLSWSSSDPQIVSVVADGETATLTALAPGMATVTVSVGTLSASAEVTVTPSKLVAIAIAPEDTTVEKGQPVTMTATGTYSDGTTADLTTTVMWASSDATVATISDAGLASTLAAGATMITATDATSGVVGTTMLTVKNAHLVSIAVAPSPASIAKGTTQAFTATGKFSDNSTADLTASATWTTSNDAIAPISATGVATGQAVGTVTITATDGVSGVSGTAMLTVRVADLVSIAVTPSGPSIAKGTTLPLTATGTYTDGTMQDLTQTATWTSSTITVATITTGPGTRGIATAKAVGMTTITASDATISGSTVLTVSPAALVSIAVAPTNPTIARTTKQAFSAVGTYTDGTMQNLTTTVTWSSSDTAVATFSTTLRGVATGIAPGTTTIRATDVASGVVGTTMLTVTSATLVSITVTPPDPTLPKGRKQQFIATGTFSDGSNQDIALSVTWSSSDPAIATVSNTVGTQGIATSIAIGTTTIGATMGGISGSTTLNVAPPVLVTFTITPANPTITIGSTQAFLATGTYSDSSTRDITATVTWRSTNTAVAVISNAAGTQGVATGLSPGTTSIIATDAATTITRQTTLTVSP